MGKGQGAHFVCFSPRMIAAADGAVLGERTRGLLALAAETLEIEDASAVAQARAMVGEPRRVVAPIT